MSGRIFTVFFILSVIVAGSLYNSRLFSDEIVYETIRMRTYTKTLVAEKFTFCGHRYIMFGGFRDPCVLHDPDCPCRR